MCLGADHGVESDWVLCLWLEVLHIDLSCNGFVTVQHRRGAFTHLYGFHPWARYILHTKRLCQSANVGCVLCEHLYIGAAES